MAAGPQFNEPLENPALSLIMDELEAGEAAVEFDDKEPQEVLAWAIDRFGKELAICCSFQADGCALIDMAHKIDPNIRVFTIDTGRMPQETYDLIDKYRQRYGIKVEIFTPDTEVVQQMVTKHGNNLFYNDVNLRLLCCQVRKVLPLRRALMNYGAWVTGLRRDQWATRSNIRKIEIDHDHGGIVKLAPLADWTEGEVWDYIRANDVPYNALYDKGYQSIGCAPCTRPGAELSLNALFMKTPRGREVAQSLAELNKALATLKGQTVEQITSTQRSPGAYALTLKTSGCQIVIRFEQAGVRVETLEVDLGR